MVTLFFSLFSPSWPLHDVLIAMRQQTAHGRVGNFGILGVPGFSVVGAGRAGRNELAAWIRHGHSMTCSPLCVSQQTAHGRVRIFGIVGVPGSPGSTSKWIPACAGMTIDRLDAHRPNGIDTGTQGPGHAWQGHEGTAFASIVGVA